MRAYEFHDEWCVATEPGQVWDVVRDVERWPQWWPRVRSVAVLARGPDGQRAWRFTFGTRLPYQMVFDAAVTEEEPGRGVSTVVTGRVQGSGSWAVEPVDGGTLVRFGWVVRPRLLWMRLLSPVARPLFVWNHRALMTEGGEALARRLGVPLLTAPVVTTRRGPSVDKRVGR